ncbi:MAG: sensory rhodopsin transducer [Candidatus Cyclobacteriaceae bacterium M3_2C_046]
METIGKRKWAVPEGYIPEYGHGKEPEFTSHGTLCFLNVNQQDAHVKIMIYFTDKDPVGPYQVTVPAQRTSHLRFNNLSDPEPVPTGTDFASFVESDIPIVVQHTRLDSRQAENALMSTIAFGSD